MAMFGTISNQPAGAMEMLIKIDPSTGDQIFLSRTPIGDDTGLEFKLASNGKMEIEAKLTNLSIHNVASASGYAAASGWIHVIFSFKMESGQFVCVIFVDGAIQGSSVVAVGGNFDLFATSNETLFEHSRLGGSTFKGAIKFIRTYSQYLDPTDSLDLFNYGNNDGTKHNCTNYWDFEALPTPLVDGTITAPNIVTPSEPLVVSGVESIEQFF